MNETAMPCNVNAERAIFSILLYSPERFIEIADLLKAKDFYYLPHQDIWQAMHSLYKQGKDIDVVSIKTELSKTNIDTKPAMVDLVKCYEEIVVGDNLKNFIEDVKNKSTLRDIISLSYKYSQDSRLEVTNASTLLANYERDLVEISDTIRDDRPTDAGGILNEIRADMARGEESGWKGFNTGFKKIDDDTGGFIPTQCWIVGGYTGCGKTFVLLQLLLNALEQGAKVMLFSTEMDRKMNMLRLLGNMAGLGTIRMLKGKLEEGEKTKMIEAEKKLSTYKRNLTIYDNVYTVEEIRLKAKKKKLREGLDVIFVDFIQNLRGDENIYERMSNAAISLQQIAQELNITMIIASQVSQAAASWSNKESIEYKGAGEIAAIADVGIWIKKVDADKNAREIILRKVRHGVPGSILVRISFPSGRIVGIDDNEGIYGEEGSVKGQL